MCLYWSCMGSHQELSLKSVLDLNCVEGLFRQTKKMSGSKGGPRRNTKEEVPVINIYWDFRFYGKFFST